MADLFVLNHLIDVWKQQDLAKLQLWLAKDFRAIFPHIAFPSEDAEYFINYVIKDTANAVEFSLQYEAMWKTIFKHEVHRKIDKRGTPFIGLLVQSGNVEVLRLLFNYPLKPNLRHVGPNADTPLHYICKQSWQGKENLYEECMVWLLENDEVDVHAFNCDFKTPLDLGKEMKNEKAVAMLSEMGDLTIDKKEEIKNLFFTIAHDPHYAFENRLKDLKGITFSQKYSCLKISKSMDHEKNELVLRRILNIDLIFTQSTKENIILLQEACRQDFRFIASPLLEVVDPCVIDEWNDNLCAISIAEEVEAISILPELWEQDVREICPKIDDRIWSLRGYNNNNILHYASKYNCPRAMYRILESSGFRLMGAENDFEQVPFVPDEVLETGVLKRFMDSQVETPEQIMDQIKGYYLKIYENRSSRIRNHNRRYIYMNLESFLTDKGSNFGIENLMGICKNKVYHRHFAHPIIKIFLLYRWERLRWIFFVNLIFCVLLTLCLTFNIVWMSTTKSDMFLTTRILQGILIILLLIREIIQGSIQRTEYFKPTQYENYFEISIILLGGFLTIAGKSNKESQHIGAFVILLSWLQLILLIGKHPKFSVQIEMFLLVLTNFAKFLFVYSLMIFAFAMAFIVLFNPGDFEGTSDIKFSGFFESIFETFVMIAGEFDSSNIPFGNYPVTSHLVFLLFVFTIAIVLLNLLNGLAVYDTQMIKHDAASYTFLARLKYLTFLDKFSKFLPRNRKGRFSKWLGRLFFTDTDKNFDHYVLDDDDDIWRELDQVLNNFPKTKKIQLENLSKQLEILEKKQSESNEKLMKLFDDLNQKIISIESKI